MWFLFVSIAYSVYTYKINIKHRYVEVMLFSGIKTIICLSIFIDLVIGYGFGCKL